jgi:hypothetical protein
MPPSYLSTEAKRVITPPLPKPKPDKSNKFTGYFWGVPPSEEKGIDDSDSDYTTPFPIPKHATNLPTSHRESMEREKDWYRVRMDAIMDDESPPYDPEEENAFEWDVPEHLPSSPLCPLNPKHRGGGKGICVYHGRGAGKGKGRVRWGGAELWK